MGKRPGARGGQETKAAAALPAGEQPRQLPAAGAQGGEQPPWARRSRRIGAVITTAALCVATGLAVAGVSASRSGRDPGQGSEGRGCLSPRLLPYCTVY